MADTIHYTKVETDAKLGDVKKIAISGIAGDLDKVLASDIPSTGYYRYDVFKAKTYTNVTPNITIEQLELDDNYISVVVNNGVADKIVMPKPQQKINLPSGGHARITIEGEINALGVASLSSLIDLPPFNTIGIDWTAPIDRVFIWNPKTNNYENLHIGVNNMASWDVDYVHPSTTPTPYPTFGPEVGVAISWIKSHEFGNLYIDKNVADGQQAYWFLKGNSTYYQEKLNRKNLADIWLQDKGITVSEDGFIWVQGESDRPTPENEYIFILNQLVSERKADGFINNDTRIIITQIGTTSAGFYSGVANAKISYVNSNQKAVLVEYTTYYNADSIHLNPTGQMDLGLNCSQHILYNDITTFIDVVPPYISNNAIRVDTSQYQEGVLRNDNVFVEDLASKTIMDIDTQGLMNLKFYGYASIVAVANVNFYATIVGIKSTGQVDVLEKSASVLSPTIINKNYDISAYERVSVSWCNYGQCAGSIPTIELWGKPDFNENPEREINLSKNTYRQLETLTETVTIPVISVGSFGNINVFQFTGGGLLFSGEISMDKNSDVYDPSKVNTVYVYSEYGQVKCLIEN